MIEDYFLCEVAGDVQMTDKVLKNNLLQKKRPRPEGICSNEKERNWFNFQISHFLRKF